MAAVLDRTPFESPRISVVANVSADIVRTPEEIRRALADQVAGAVRWTDCLRRLAAEGITRFVEVGPGRVLTGLTSRTLPGVEAITSDRLLNPG
jgi:malonyl CoA-acyl carrier protein transacylase